MSGGLYEFSLISAHYSGKTTEGSGLPYMRHIEQGITVLAYIEASDTAAKAFCLHPLVQADEDLAANFEWLCRDPEVSVAALVMAMEYRHVANAFLSQMESHPGYKDHKAITLSPLADVNLMLIADKIQNRADFLRFHLETHPRAHWLVKYFDIWLEALGVSHKQYGELARVMGGHSGIAVSYSA